MLSLGIHVAGGSDAPIEVPNPFAGLHASIFRHNKNGIHFYDSCSHFIIIIYTCFAGVTWMPEQCLTMNEALSVYTEEAAFAAGKEDKVGKLQPAFWADFLVLNEDVLVNNEKLSLPPLSLLESVWVAGKKRL